MVKKRNRDPEVLEDAPPVKVDGDDSGSDDDMDIVNVEFEWFNFKPDIDFHGLKSLLRQLFDVDNQLFDLSALAELILNQYTIGSTVKVDGEDTDAYAFLTVLNLYEHREQKVIKDLIQYLVSKTSNSDGWSSLGELIQSKQVGLVLGERLINVPSEISPPMYTMLIEEIADAVEDKEPYEFTHYLILSKTYNEIASALDAEEKPRSKKNKKGGASLETFYFHPEDEVLHKHASAVASWDYTKDEGEGMADSKRAFSDMGIKTKGSAILIEASKFEGAVRGVGEYLSPPQ